jgi:hypothetical protein
MVKVVPAGRTLRRTCTLSDIGARRVQRGRGGQGISRARGNGLPLAGHSLTPASSGRARLSSAGRRASAVVTSGARVAFAAGTEAQAAIGSAPLPCCGSMLPLASRWRT